MLQIYIYIYIIYDIPITLYVILYRDNRGLKAIAYYMHIIIIYIVHIGIRLCYVRVRNIVLKCLFEVGNQRRSFRFCNYCPSSSACILYFLRHVSFENTFCFTIIIYKLRIISTGVSYTLSHRIRSYTYRRRVQIYTERSKNHGTKMIRIVYMIQCFILLITLTINLTCLY